MNDEKEKEKEKELDECPNTECIACRVNCPYKK
jgi:hypothetical protein